MQEVLEDYQWTWKRRGIVGGDSTTSGVGGRSKGGVFEPVFAEERESKQKGIDLHGSECRGSTSVK